MEEKKEREGEAESLSPETPQTGRLRGRSRKRTDAPEGKKKAGRIALGSRHWDRRPGGGRGRILLPGNGKV